MPGVSVTTDVRSGPVAPDTGPGATFFAVGIAERGSVAAAIEVFSYPDFVDKCGPWVAYGALADAVRCYFEEGGSHAYVARAVGPAAAVGNLVLQDRAGVPVNTLRVEAKDPGAWSAGLTVQVEDGGQAGTFRLTVRYAGTGGPGVEVYDNLATVAAAVAALSASAYVRGVDLASPSGVLAIPVVRAATALSAGADDRGAVTAAIMTAALARFGADLGPGLVAIPGQTTAAVGAAVLAHAAANRRCSALAAVRGASDAAKIAEAQALRDNVGADGAGVFAPWVVIPDGAGGRRTVDPVGYVAGCWARAHLTEGPFRAAAGSLAAARFVLDVDEQLDRVRGDALDAGEVNAIRVITIPDGRRVETYGWRSLSRDENNFALLTGRATLNVLDWNASRAAEDIVFRTVDGQGRTLSDLNAVLLAVAQEMADRGGLYPERVNGRQVDPGYSVDTGPAVNPPAQLQANILAGNLGARVSPTGALVQIRITKVAVTANL
jgi:hypothetical protein